MARILIVGLDHFLQNAEDDVQCRSVKGRESELGQKRAFRDWLTCVIQQRGCQFIADEAKLDREVLTEQVAARCGCRYSKITMPTDERERRGIMRDYDADEHTRTAAHRGFENHMTERIQQDIAAAESVIVLCGNEHRPNIATRMTELHHEVETTNALDCDWFEGIPAESIEGEFLGFFHEL